MGLDNPGDQIDGKPSSETMTEKSIAGRSPFQLAMQQIRRDRVAVICVIIVIFFLLVAILAPLICKLLGISPDAQSGTVLLDSTGPDGMPVIGPPNNGFTFDHPLGISPNTARDNLALWIYGARTSITVAVVATVISTILGITVGLIAGFARGAFEAVMSWLIDFFLSMPYILVALSVAPIVIGRFATRPQLLTYAQFGALLLVLSVFGWMPLARLIRGEVLSLREREFVQAARVIGVSTPAILRRELLPNLIAPIIVFFSLSIPTFVSAEAALAYLGIGVIGIPSWGQTINLGVDYFNAYPLYLWAPIVGVLTLVVALNLLGDSIRDAFDPKTRR